MEYGIYKLKFPFGVHFGDKSLEKSNITFCADTLFSALCIEALKIEGEFEKFFKCVKEGKLLFSDGFPFLDKEFFLPKPIIAVNKKDTNASELKKQFKKMNFIAMSKWETYLKGELDPGEEIDLEKKFGVHKTETHCAIRGLEETLPYRIGSFSFSKNAGLYVVFGYENDEIRQLFYELLDRVSYSGLGGKRSAGLGRFIIYPGEIPDNIKKLLENDSERYLSLSIGLPQDDEIDSSLEGATYSLLKRSGFVESVNYSDSYMRKKDLYMFASGSVFSQRFGGDIYDVSTGGSHPVYRYGKPIFIGV